MPGEAAQRGVGRIAFAVILALALLGALAVLGAGLISAPIASATEPSGAGPVCFYQAGYPLCFARPGQELSVAPQDASVEMLVDTLLQGPTPDERVRGIESAIPAGTELVSVETSSPADREAGGLTVTVRLAFPAGYLDLPATTPPQEAPSPAGEAQTRLDALAVEAIQDQIIRTLFPLGYRHFSIEAQDPAAPGSFRPLSAYLPPIHIPSKGEGQPGGMASTAGAVEPANQPPVEVQGRPTGALTGKTVYVSAGHGWEWDGSGWHTQRPPYPDASTGYDGPIIEDHNNAEIVNQYLVRYLWNAGADVWTVRERDLNSFKHIVDDGAPGFEAVGAWGTVHDAGYGQEYLQTFTAPGGGASATWTLGPVAADGSYALYVWYAHGSDRTADAAYTVYHAGGSTDFLLDQRYHGYTWRYVGRFPVRAGEYLTVRLSNASAISGRVVVADAVRLGGGRFEDGDLGTNGGPVQTDAPFAPNRSWWEVSAYYQVQRLGLNPNEFSYFNDIVARPFWARWEHIDSGEDAVYVSWHSNGYNGHNTTLWGTVSYIHSFQPVPGSAELRDAIHNELINDIRAGWDADWRDLGKATRDLGELRELWDENPTNGLPGALIEVAYHDHVGNADALKDPRFALLSARAVYQGIVRYFGRDLPLLPEPPTHLAIRNDGPGQLRVSWQPSPTDDAGLVGDAATSYRVYTSHDGIGWDNGRPVVGTETLLAGLSRDELIFVRVTAVNDGGESFPTPTLAGRASGNGTAQVLIVDGFDRIDRHGLPLENDPDEGWNARLFPERINRYDYVIEHARYITLPFDSAVNEAVRDGALDLQAYQIVDWVLGEESTVDQTLDPTEQTAVAAYLNGGGGLFISGAEIGWDLVSRGHGPDFFHTYLGAEMVGDDAGTYVAMPTTEGILAGLPPISFREHYDVDYPDQLSPQAGSVSTLSYLGGDGGTAAIQYDAGGCRRVVFFGFPFETIDPLSKPEVMARILGYLGAGGCLVTAPETAILAPVSGSAFNTVPAFNGTAQGLNPIDRVEVQIHSPDARYWNGSQWAADPAWLAASGTSTWYYPLPALTQGDYKLGARAWDTDAASDNSPAWVTFTYDTLSPAAPLLIAPGDGITLTGAPAFSWQGPSGDTGSALGYELQMDSQTVPVSLTQYTPLIWPRAGGHRWRVRTVDAAGNPSAWTEFRTFFMQTHDFVLPLILRH
jgi:N-acetylmuramoyl-L-alanine amidase